jgi:hypothetical protein
MGIRYINAEPNLKFTRPTGFEFPTGLNATAANTVVDYLVVAGGGGGNGGLAGAGGAGGFRQGSNFPVSVSTPYTIVVGGGGPGIDGTPAILAKGSNSSFSTIISEGGGGGGGATGGGQNAPGSSGGSGGGSGGESSTVGGLANTSVPQGNNGSFTSGAIGGAGGGAGAAGGTPVTGKGGVGLTNSFLSTAQATSLSVGEVSGPVVYFSGGGSGSTAGDNPAYSSPGLTGGLGGGGTGAKSPVAGTSGTAFTGGGGGATFGYVEGAGGGGGKGVVIVRYLGSQAATGGANVTSSGGYTVHTFTGDNTFATNADFGGATTFSIN